MQEALKLQQRVAAELEFTPEVNAAHIGVAVREGVVTLTGHVASVHEKLAAEEAVRRVKGVRAVAQKLEVHLASDKKLGDDEIAARAVRLLDWDICLPKGAVGITVSEGIVRLSGEVEWYFQRREAERDMHKLGGVKGVINDIRLRPKTPAGTLHHSLHAAFERGAQFETAQITVTGQDGKLVLAGEVNTLTDLIAAHDAAWSASGVTAVELQIAVRSRSAKAGPQRAH